MDSGASRSAGRKARRTTLPLQTVLALDNAHRDPVELGWNLRRPLRNGPNVYLNHELFGTLPLADVDHGHVGMAKEVGGKLVTRGACACACVSLLAHLGLGMDGDSALSVRKQEVSHRPTPVGYGDTTGFEIDVQRE